MKVRVFHLGPKSRECSLSYLASRERMTAAEYEAFMVRCRALAIEIAPGVFAMSLGHGSTIFPGEGTEIEVVQGTQIAVWDERRKA